MKASELTTLDVEKLQSDVFETAKSKGWWDDCVVDGEFSIPLAETSVPEKNALFHTEITEAFEDFIAGLMETTIRSDSKPTGFGSELADVCIRGLDLSGAVAAPVAKALRHLDVADNLSVLAEEERDVFIAFGLLRIHQCASHALESYRRDKMSLVIGDDGAPSGFPADIAKMIRTCYVIAKRLDIDLDAEILVKAQYNRGRSHRHGGKRA